MEEIWKDIPSYEGMYQVSNVGRVKSLSRMLLNRGKYPFFSKEKYLKASVNSTGYMVVALCNKNQKSYHVHVLVAMAFLGHTPDGMTLVINHKNFDKLDNRVDNLEITTQRQNANMKHLNSTSEYTGVYWCNKSLKYRSVIVFKSKLISLGSYINEYNAHVAYQKALQRITKGLHPK